MDGATLATVIGNGGSVAASWDREDGREGSQSNEDLSEHGESAENVEKFVGLTKVTQRRAQVIILSPKMLGLFSWTQATTIWYH